MQMQDWSQCLSCCVYFWVHLTDNCSGLILLLENFLHKSDTAGKGLFHLICHCLSSQEVRTGAQGRNLEVVTETETMEDHCFLDCPQAHIQLILLYNPGTHANEWYPQGSNTFCISKQSKRYPTVSLQANLREVVSSTEVFSFQVFQVDSQDYHKSTLCQLDRQTYHCWTLTFPCPPDLMLISQYRTQAGTQRDIPESKWICYVAINR